MLSKSYIKLKVVLNLNIWPSKIVNPLTHTPIVTQVGILTFTFCYNKVSI